MLIGIISDTHNDSSSIDRAIDLFNHRNVDLVLHCGDICLPQYLAPFANLKCKVKAVFGNNDYYQDALRKTILNFGTIEKAPLKFKIKEKSFIMSHLPIYNLDKKYDFVLYGHTHLADLLRIEDTIKLNPGEACGFRYGAQTVAFIDMDKDSVEIVRLEDRKVLRKI
ncbi:MAG: metallophosphoesterase [Elusimicrobiota bacterium]|jgi:putative phosphoesterase|nr:metallophosphoesterase [Elusimicrobiota bacterium]